MKWFEGGIPNAIQAAKDNKSVFIVFISGEDDASSEMESFLHKESVTDLCEENKCVAVKLISNSNDCSFFSQIFPVVVIPSTFFIGSNGTPLEVIGECKSPEDFLARVQSAISLQNPTGQMRSAGAGELRETNEEADKPPQTDQDGSSSSSPSHHDDLSQEAEGAVGGDDSVSPEKIAKLDDLTKEEKVERAKQLIQEKRDEKMRKEAEEAKRKEIERRSVGQGVQKLRQSQKEMEVLEAKKELKKEREDDKAARQRVKEQIARDRAEKNARFNEAKEERDRAMEEARKRKLMEQQAAAAAEQARRSDIARIQFRLPDGSSITQQFPATDTFASVHRFITEQTSYAMSLSTTFPKRTFTEADHGSTLQDLALAPSAVILVIPNRGGVRSAASGGGSSALGITNILFAPFIFLWNIIASLFGLSSSSSSSSSSAPPPPPLSAQPTLAKGGERDQGGARQREVSSVASRQEGGIRRFHNAEDDEDDEDRATWNGNSTQQM